MSDLITYAGEVALSKARQRSPLAATKYFDRQVRRKKRAEATIPLTYQPSDRVYGKKGRKVYDALKKIKANVNVNGRPVRG